MTDLTIAIETEIVRVLKENNITELTLKNSVPVIISNGIMKISEIKIADEHYNEILFRFEGMVSWSACDDFPTATNLFRVPYMEILMETLETLEPNCLD